MPETSGIMKPRRPTLIAQMADLLDRMAFALETVNACVPRAPGSDPAVPPTFAPSVSRLAEEARALVREQQQQEGGRRG